MNDKERLDALDKTEENGWNDLAKGLLIDSALIRIERCQQVRLNLQKLDPRWCTCQGPGLHLLGSVVCDSRMSG